MTTSDDDAIAAGSGSDADDWAAVAGAAAAREIAPVLMELFAPREDLEALRAEVADLREQLERLRRSGPAW